MSIGLCPVTSRTMAARSVRLDLASAATRSAGPDRPPQRPRGTGEAPIPSPTVSIKLEIFPKTHTSGAFCHIIPLILPCPD